MLRAMNEDRCVILRGDDFPLILVGPHAAESAADKTLTVVSQGER
jgi:hypothetical protein